MTAPSAESHHERFERLVVPVFTVPFADAIAESLAGCGDGVLVDLACGTGASTRAARSGFPTNPVVGVDVDDSALRHAQALAPDVSWVAAPAAALPFAGESVTAVVVQQGAQFLAEDATCAELARILSTGGLAVLLTWTPSGAPMFGALDDALVAASVPGGPQYRRPTSFDLDRWVAAAGAHGLTVVARDEIQRPFAVEDVRAFVEHFIEPGDDARVRAVDIAEERLHALIAGGAPLVAARVVLRAP